MAETFNVGDVVFLKSGSMPMTVRYLDDNDYGVSWIDKDGKLQHAGLDPRMLTKDTACKIVYT